MSLKLDWYYNGNKTLEVQIDIVQDFINWGQHIDKKIEFEKPRHRKRHTKLTITSL